MKRFYREVSVSQTELGWNVQLDGRAIKTQSGSPQVVPTRHLAELLAKEWDEQGETIEPASFRFRDMVDYAIDVVASDREAIVDKLLGYAETDTLCYRAHPDEPFYRRQEEVWEPLVSEIEAREGVAMARVSGIIHKPQSRESLAVLRRRMEGLDALELAALDLATSLAASICIGLAALEEGADGKALWDAANLEEDWQAEQWGQDEEASERRAKRENDFLAAMEFAAALRA